LNEILKALEEGKSFWWCWVDRLGSCYDKKFEANWKEEGKEFWKSFQPGSNKWDSRFVFVALLNK
jgi:hypothetical protein